MGNCNLPILMTLVVVSVVGFTSLAEAQNATCAQSLIPCANYINSTSPPANCCSSIKDAVDTQLSCLCGLYTSPGLLQSFGVTVEQALKLSKACGVDTDLTKCNVTAAAGPGSSTPESTFQLCASRRFCADFKTEKLNPLHPSGRPCQPFERSSVKQHPSGRCGYSIWIPISVQKLRTVQGCIRPDVSATHPDAI